MESFTCLYPLLALLIAALTALHFFFFKQSPPSTPGQILKSYPIVGTLPHVISNSHRILDWSTALLAAAKTGTVVVFPFVFTADPANVEHISKSNFDNYPKNGFFSASMHDLIGEGIIIVDGEQWKLQRKLASHEFSTASLRSFVLDKVNDKISGSLLPLLDIAGQSGAVVDLQDVLERFAFDSICRILFNYDPDSISGVNAEGDQFFSSFELAAHLSVERAKLPFAAIWKLKKLFDVGSERKLRQSLQKVHGIIDRFIMCERSKNDGDEEKERDFLSQFARVGALSDKLLRDMLVSFMIAGRDTTPSALTWFFWLLSTRSPTVVSEIREEIRSVRASHGLKEDESFTLDSLRAMQYLHAAISESIRLYPPVTIVSREARTADTLPDGTAVGKGWMVMVNVYAMGRSERIWGEGWGEFRPERWLQAEGAFRARSPFEYAAFHGGPRMCLGKEMAYIQMKAVAASVLERFEVEVAEERERHQVSMALRMEGGLPVRVRERGV